MTTKLQLLLLATSVGAACGNAWAAPSYTLTDNVAPGARVSLEYEHNTGAPSPFYGYYLTEFPSMNDNGVIVGRTKKANSSNPLITNTAGQAAKWTGGVKANLQLAGCKDANNDGVADNTLCGSRALNINNAGIAGGSSNDWLAASDTYFEKAYSWSADTLLKKKVGINYSSQSQVEDVNEKGEYAASGITVGGGYPYDGFPHATIETPTASVLIGVTYQVTTAHAINESRMVAGAAAFNLNNVFTYNATNPYMAYRFGDRFIWGGYLPGGTYSDAYDVNDNGLVVGRANTSTGKIHAFKWESKGDGRYLSQDKYGAFKNYSGEVNTFLVDLGSLHSSGESVARSTNNHGHIVGWSDKLVTNVTVKRAFIYIDGAMNDINDLVTSRNGWTFVDAYAVNERGEVLVRGTKAGVEDQYMVVKPTTTFTPITTIATWSDTPLDPASGITPLIPLISGVGPVPQTKTLAADAYACLTSCTTYPEIQGKYYGTIQQALNAVGTGKTVMVLPGTYKEAVNFVGKNLISWKGPGETKIDATGLSKAVVKVECRTVNCTIEGFYITGGNAYSTSYPYGGGVSATGDYDFYKFGVTLKNSFVSGNRAYGGGGVYGNGLVTVQNSDISKNTADDGGGVFTVRVINNSVISNNTANQTGGGVSYSFFISNSVIANNTVLATGNYGAGGVNGAWSINNCLITGNKANFYSAILSWGGTVPTKIVNTTIAYNKNFWDNATTIHVTGDFINSVSYGNGGSLSNKTTSIGSNIGTLAGSIIEYGDRYNYPGDIDVDPKFVNAKNGDFNLATTSPAIDMGVNTNSATYSFGVTSDIAGKARGLDGRGDGKVTSDFSDYDIGAFETVR